MAMIDVEATPKTVRSESDTPLIDHIQRTVIVIAAQTDASKASGEKKLSERIPAFGLVLALISVVFLSFQSVVVKLLVDMHAIQVLVFRCGIMSIVFTIASIKSRHSLLGPHDTRVYLMLRCIIGTIGISTIYMSYKLIPIADAATIHSSSPVFVTVFAYFLLKESLTLVQIITCLFTLMGVVFVSKPEFIFGDEDEAAHERQVEGTVLAMISTLCSACCVICLRKMKSTPVCVGVMWFATTVFIMGSIALYIIDAFVWPTGTKTWLLLLTAGLCGVGGHYFYTKAFHYENAGPIAVTRSFNIVLTFLWEVVLLHESVEWTSITGAAIILCCVLTLALNKWKIENPVLFDKLVSIFVCKNNIIKN